MNPETAPLLTAIAPIVDLPHSGYADPKGTNGNLPVLLIRGLLAETVQPGAESDTYTESSDGDHFYYVPASAITSIWANGHSCDNGPTRVNVPGVGPGTQCKTHCTAQELPLPQVIDCRFSGGHGDAPTWTSDVMLRFYNAHATRRSCSGFVEEYACDAESLRCGWSSDMCVEATVEPQVEPPVEPPTPTKHTCFSG